MGGKEKKKEKRKNKEENGRTRKKKEGTRPQTRKRRKGRSRWPRGAPQFAFLGSGGAEGSAERGRRLTLPQSTARGRPRSTLARPPRPLCAPAARAARLGLGHRSPAGTDGLPAEPTHRRWGGGVWRGCGKQPPPLCAPPQDEAVSLCRRSAPARPDLLPSCALW